MACAKNQSVQLAGNSMCRVVACTCGTVRVTSGGLTMTLDMPAFLKIASVIEQAAMKLVSSAEFVPSECQTSANKLH